VECRRLLEERLYSRPYALNIVAVIADTSSWAAAVRSLVALAAAALAALIAEPISAVSAAAVATSWGCEIKLVIGSSLPT
jgi:hypothetical protein